MAAVVREWSPDGRLGPLLADPDGVFLLLDETANRILDASPAALGLRRGIAGADASLLPALRLEDQIRPAFLVEGRPALLRIRFDARRRGLPSTCLVVRTPVSPGGAVVLLVALTDRPPLLRPLTADATRAVVEAKISSPRQLETVEWDSRMAAASGPPRFTWRSDERGVLIQMSGPAVGAVNRPMIGRSWQALSREGVLADAEGLLAALAARRTFRAIPITLRREAIYDLEISGAPLERAGRSFKGFGGFGLVRPSALAAEPAIGDPDSEGPRETEGHAPSTTPSGEDAAVPATPPIEALETRLSSNEHAAFREIARALGARFAGDDEAPAVDRIEAGDTLRLPVCSVMPFPAQGARPVEAGTQDSDDAAVVDTLERLPTGVLVYRGDAALFANRTLLDLAGLSGIADLEASGGVARLFGGLAPHERPESEGPTILATHGGGALSVDLQRSVIDWRGLPAELLLIRDASAGEPDRHRTAAQIAEDFAGLRAADALAVLDTLDDGIVTLDGQARILSLNRSAAATFGLDPREVVGASFINLFAPESAVEILAGIHGIPGPAHATLPESIEVRARGRGGLVPMQIRIAPLQAAASRAGQSGEDRRLSVVIRDLQAAQFAEAEEAKARRAAESASARKSDFLAKISHEIRTPMNGILGFADLMLAEAFGPIGSERYRDYLGDIHASGTHVLSLVNDLLDLAKIEAGRLDLTFTEVPLNAIVSGCVTMMQAQAARDRIVVRTSFSADLSTLVADERSLRQAALNVIANAINFTEAGGQVIVSTAMADRGEIALRVRDTGIGMTPEEIETALEPFRQVAVARPRAGVGKPGGKASGRETGTGLGLPLTKALVEANHGRFRITSRKDEGTLVEMLFPASQATMTA